MKVAGFTIIRNAVTYDYPVVEAIRSILPVCDIFIAAVGKSDDETLTLIKSIGDPKIQILETEWDLTLRTGGALLAIETNKALDAIPGDVDWCFYIQSDEVVHESDLPGIRQVMEVHLHHQEVEGLLFDYLHFYGSYDYVGASRRWYRHEVRIVRNLKAIRSYRDAQGFRKTGEAKLTVASSGGRIFHYGWVRPPETLHHKIRSFARLWHDDAKADAIAGPATDFRYDGKIPLKRFEGTHPAVMHSRIQSRNWQFEGNPEEAQWPLKERISQFIFEKTGWIPGEYKGYKLIT